MNLNELRYTIESSFSGCRTCEEPIDSWPDVEPKADPGHKVMYIARDAVFVGICSSGHVNEAYLAEVKADEIVLHDVTERTCGKFIPQTECTHAHRAKFQIGAGEAMPSSDGVIEGPATGFVCGLCLAKFGVIKGPKKAKFGLLGLDGKPIENDG